LQTVNFSCERSVRLHCQGLQFLRSSLCTSYLDGKKASLISMSDDISILAYK
jgi:hypothetical protein